MLDIKLVRQNPELIKKNLRDRGMVNKLELVDELLKLDMEISTLRRRSQELRKERNKAAREIAELKQKGLRVDEKIKEVSSILDEIKQVEEKLERLMKKQREIMLVLPNLMHESTPVGEENVVVREYGRIRKFDFEPRDHVKLMVDLGILDISRAAKISGARFFFLKNEGVLLEHALMRLAIDKLIRKGYTLVEPPFMMKRAAYEGVVPLGDFDEMLYKVEGEDLHLIATSEHPLVSMFMGECFEEDELPIKLVGFSPNFRKEAGAHGKDTKGIFRTHQFYKVEQIIICKPEDSWRFHEELITNAEEIFKELEVPFRTVVLCSQQLSSMAAKCYDIEAWLPAQNKYREMGSCSNCTDFQARRLRIRYRSGGEVGLVHTLNSTAITTRAIVAIVENHQQKDGSVRIPRALVQYMNGMEVLKCRRR
ncbi:MAG: serine--tRNA ligase [Candidatus Nanoarchaeia archaeon]|nr:serine--tRNA ligase [Candidatus Haiyanarchaeum thermophilum]MCW1302826.1 serine--tRNA ligase [Candidatus Haiyanarchaeum thermophilum]MCW1303507.1 serine--tRNA ligase [Candidatus Haiyanarchaeum thermophilum]MCW1306687.1 serine--tRNA ligase [Candidatus Haiyanarchaeum thermophilum]MCW1307973.1 serine--tRNA ligase [Candidatus Haiyanarchaeum thermophilum]